MAFETVRLLPTSKTASAGGASGRAAYLKSRYKIQSWGLDNNSPAITISLMPRGAGSIGTQDYDDYRKEVVDSFKSFGYEPEEPHKVEVVEVAVAKVEVEGEQGN